MLPFPSSLYDKAATFPGYHSQTSEAILKDFLDYVCRHRDRGDGIVEVGCYKGSSSIVLAYLCQELDMPFHVIDVNAEYLNGVRELLKFVGLTVGPHFFHGTLTEFSNKVELAAPPVFIFIDGDHRYDGVVKDLHALFRLNQRPHCAAFHDFSLRYSPELNPELQVVRVDEAIYDTLGRDVPLTRVGLQFPNGTGMPKKKNTTYWKKNGSEGVLIELDGLHPVNQSPQSHST